MPGPLQDDASAMGHDAATAIDAGPVAALPADVLDLTNWKITLPTGPDGKPTEVEQPDLATLSVHPHFELSAARDGVVFNAPAGGVTTENSSYPRSELREMTVSGAEPAAWSTSSGVHTMAITQAITHLPAVKPHVVAGQIHDADDDVVMIRLESERLFVEAGGSDVGPLDPHYVLGTPFTVRLQASSGRIAVYYGDLNTPKVDIARDASGCYFKAGVYTQSNPERGDAPEAYGEVVIYALEVTHE
jgi:hypothetical protein